MLAILDKNKNVVPVSGTLDWAKGFEEQDRIVQQTPLLGWFGKNIVISTVFLGIDHGFGGTPKWFETMVFAGSWTDRECHRYATYDEAVAGHAVVVRRWKWKRFYYPVTETCAKVKYWWLEHYWRGKRAGAKFLAARSRASLARTDDNERKDRKNG